MNRVKVLAVAYACEPNKGSEPGVGWNWVKQIARFADVWVITRGNNREVIEGVLKKTPEPHMHFICVDYPKLIRFWKKGQRGVHLYYFLWQFLAFYYGYKLHKKVNFDLVHHITFVNDWFHSLFALFPIPFIWGPIGSNSLVPLEFHCNFKSYMSDLTKNMLITLARVCNPLYWITIGRARKIILIKESLRDKFPFRFVNQQKILVQCAVGIDQSIDQSLAESKHAKKDFIIFYSAGNLISIKGFHLAIMAFYKALNKVRNMKLIIAGDGPLRKRLKEMTERFSITQFVTFTGKLPRSDVLKYISEADVFLFPSFEAGGMVVLEAMINGLPVICLDVGGPGEMVCDNCGIKVQANGVSQVVDELADGIVNFASDFTLRLTMGENARAHAKRMYSWSGKGSFLKEVYSDVLKYQQ